MYNRIIIGLAMNLSKLIDGGNAAQISIGVFRKIKGVSMFGNCNECQQRYYAKKACFKFVTNHSVLIRYKTLPI